MVGDGLLPSEVEADDFLRKLHHRFRFFAIGEATAAEQMGAGLLVSWQFIP